MGKDYCIPGPMADADAARVADATSLVTKQVQP